MSWGYNGSGPADLARSLLIHALGDAARCTVCSGTGQVVYDALTNDELPVDQHDPDTQILEDGVAVPRYSGGQGGRRRACVGSTSPRTTATTCLRW